MPQLGSEKQLSQFLSSEGDTFQLSESRATRTIQAQQSSVKQTEDDSSDATNPFYEMNSPVIAREPESRNKQMESVPSAVPEKSAEKLAKLIYD